MNHSSLKACLALLCVSTVATLLSPLPALSAPKHRLRSVKAHARSGRSPYTARVVDHDPMAIQFSSLIGLRRHHFGRSLTDLNLNLVETGTTFLVSVYTASDDTDKDSILLEMYIKFQHRSKKLTQLVNTTSTNFFNLVPVDPDPQNRGASFIKYGVAQFALNFSDSVIASLPATNRKVFLVAVKASEKGDNDNPKNECFQTITVVRPPPPPPLNRQYKAKGKSAGKRSGGRRTHG